MTRIAAVLMLLGAAAAHGAGMPAPEPKLELGAGGIVLGLPDYRGSDRYGARVYPIPYAAYRGERVQVTREGLRARLFSVERLTLSLSAAANLPGNDNNPERAGMPQIDPTFEAGPSLDWLLHEAGTGMLKLRARLPVRSAIAADGRNIKSIGWTAIPHFRVDYGERRGEWSRIYAAGVGVVFAGEDYHEYFYGVAPADADAALGRLAYDAHGGYGGARLNLSATFHYARWRVGLFGSYDWMRGAAYDDSPLFKTEHSLVSGLYVTYRLYARGTGVSLEGEGL